MQKGCMCPTNYRHDRCEGATTQGSARYTEEFARLVYQAFQEEFSFYGLLQECEGSSSIQRPSVEESCVLVRIPFLERHQLQCGSCLLGRDVVPGTEVFPAESAAEQAHLTNIPTARVNSRPVDCVGCPKPI